MLSDRAAICAPMVDRAVIAVHQATPRLAGDRVRAAMARFGIESMALLPDLAEFFAPGDGDLWILGLRYRYGDANVLDDWRSNGLVVGDDPSDRMVGFCQELLDIRSEVAAGLWESGTAAAVADVALEAIEAAAGPLVERARALPRPDQPQARCHHALTLMRYGRHDAHAAAWMLRQLDGRAVEALTRGVVEVEDTGSFHAMQARDLIDHVGVITARGRAVLDAIERDTNVWSSPMIVVIGARWDRWMDGLTELAAGYSTARS